MTSYDCFINPGTHEKLKECCSAVLPKKRKRHMETKHWSYIKYAKKKFSSKPVKKAAESTIYIDLEHVDPPQQPQQTRNEHHPSGNVSLPSNVFLMSFSLNTLLDSDSNSCPMLK